jgi:hypothetical protein
MVKPILFCQLKTPDRGLVIVNFGLSIFVISKNNRRFLQKNKFSQKKHGKENSALMLRIKSCKFLFFDMPQNYLHENGGHKKKVRVSKLSSWHIQFED